MNSMPHINRARVLKIESDRFLIDIGGEGELCFSRKKIKNAGGMIVGDFVEAVRTGEHYILEKILPRKNSLVRPAVANIDQLIIVVAPTPETDYFLVDKLIIAAKKEGLDVVICINKSDIGTLDKQSLEREYVADADAIVSVSAKTGNIDDLEAVLSGKLSCFAGQSAVGKSSLINTLLKKELQVTGALSEKIGRGRNTTTKAEIIALPSGGYIVDTPGFTMLDIFGIEPEELWRYYSSFLEPASKCRFNSCTHTVEPECGIKAAVKNGTIPLEKYTRYVIMYEELKDKKQKQYK